MLTTTDAAPAQATEPQQPSATVLVKTTRTFDNGAVHTDRSEIPWPGYTADQALANRLARLRAAPTTVTREGMSLTTTLRRDGWNEQAVLTFTDTPPAPAVRPR